MSYDPEPEIRDYLERLSTAARDLPQARRDELLGEIEQHIRQALAQTPCTNRDEIVALLEQVGDPAEIAAAAEDRDDPGPSVAPPRKPRRRSRIVALVALALVALAIGAAAWIQSYQPLAFGPEDVLAANSVNTFGEDGHGAWVGYSDGIGGANRPFFGVAIQNTGHFTVRVLGLGNYAPPLPLLRGWSARVLMARGRFVKESPRGPVAGPGRAPVRTVWERGRLRPFQPVDLEPGQMVMVVLRGVWHMDCVRAGAGSLTPPRDFPIKYSFLWKTTTAEIPIPGGLRIDPHNPHPRTDCHRRQVTG